MAASGDTAEASSPGGVVRVQVGTDGRTMRIRLSPRAMCLSAAELANDVVCVNTLAAMRLQVTQHARTPAEFAAYATYVDRCCGIRRGQRPVARTPAADAMVTPYVVQDHQRAAALVVGRLKRIEALLADALGITERVGGRGDVVVSVDAAGRLLGLWLSTRCMDLASAAELEDVINRALIDIASPGDSGRLTRSA
jgi:hypothetical protein